MKTIKDQTFDYERALYGEHDCYIASCKFSGPADGESAMKETQDLTINQCHLDLRYPLWHTIGTNIQNSTFTKNCRAALWYDKTLSIRDCKFAGPKAIRECSNVIIKNSEIDSTEFAWKCENLVINKVNVKHSEYPFFELKNGTIKQLKLNAKYSFQYAENIEITDSKLTTKDAFWHAKNVIIHDSIIKSEYIGWYSENLKLVNCTILGIQPFCYCKNLVLENCKMPDATLAFEKSSVTANLIGTIPEIKNPLSGRIEADEIGNMILDNVVCNLNNIEIVCSKICYS